MELYQETPALSPARHYRPVLEVKIASNGALLCATEARYDTLQQYIEQFAAPLSSLRGVGLWTFYDPIGPQCTLLLQCEPEPWCDRCLQALAVCACPF